MRFAVQAVLAIVIGALITFGSQTSVSATLFSGETVVENREGRSEVSEWFREGKNGGNEEAEEWIEIYKVSGPEPTEESHEQWFRGDPWVNPAEEMKESGLLDEENSVEGAYEWWKEDPDGYRP